MINSVAGINVVTFCENFFTIGVVAGILILRMMDVMWTGKYIVFAIKKINKKITLLMSQSPCYTTAYQQEKNMQIYHCYIHQKMSNITQNIHDFWPHAMDVTRDRKTNCNIKSSFMHNVLHIDIFLFVGKC